MTAMQELIQGLDPIHSAVNDKANELVTKERQQLFDAMMYALDEDGHNGEWKLKFINNYLDNLYNK